MNDLIVHAVLAVEIFYMGEMLGKLVLAVDQCILIGKETPAQGLVFTCDAVKQVLLHIPEVLDDFFSNREVCLAVVSWLETLKGAYLEDILFLRHVQGWINADARIIRHLHGIHATHAGADDEINFILSTIVLEKGQCLLRVDRNIRCKHIEFLHILSKTSCRIASAARPVAVKINDSFHCFIKCC